MTVDGGWESQSPNAIARKNWWYLNEHQNQLQGHAQGQGQGQSHAAKVQIRDIQKMA